MSGELPPCLVSFETTKREATLAAGVHTALRGDVIEAADLDNGLFLTVRPGATVTVTPDWTFPLYDWLLEQVER